MKKKEMRKIKFALCPLVLSALFTATSANADQWNLIYTGPGASGNIIFTGTPLTSTTGQITFASGIINGAAVTGLSYWFSPDNILVTAGNTFATWQGISLATTAGISYKLWDFAGEGMHAASTELGYVWGPQISFTLSSVTAPVPEPESYAMLLAGLGLIGAAVKRRNVKRA